MKEQKNNTSKQIKVLENDNETLRNEYEAIRAEMNNLKEFVASFISKETELESHSSSSESGDSKSSVSLTEREERLIEEIKELKISESKLCDELQQAKSINNKLLEENKILKNEIIQLNKPAIIDSTMQVPVSLPSQGQGLPSLPVAQTPQNKIDKEASGTTHQHEAKPSLFFLCDSNGKYLRLNKLCPNHEVTYSRSPTIKTATDLINDSDPRNRPSTVLFHTGTNDLEFTDANSVAQDICQLLSATSQKYPDSKILFSSLLPRKDNLHVKTGEVNAFVKQNTTKLSNVQVIEHDNLFNTNKDILHDKKHLNRHGLSVFARNLTRTIYKGNLQHPNRTSQTQSSQSRPSVPNIKQPSTPGAVRRTATYSYSEALTRRASCQPADVQQLPFHRRPHAGVNYQASSPVPTQPHFIFSNTGAAGLPNNAPIALTLTPEQLGIIKSSFYGS